MHYYDIAIIFAGAAFLLLLLPGGWFLNLLGWISLLTALCLFGIGATENDRHPAVLASQAAYFAKQKAKRQGG